MRTNQTDCATTQFQVLSQDQIERVFLGALDLLDRVGARIFSEEARGVLTAAGVSVDVEIARIPAGLVKEMLASVPPRIVVGNRDGERSLILESHCIHYGTGSDCPFIIDADTGARRSFLKRDIEDAARVVDACPTWTSTCPLD